MQSPTDDVILNDGCGAKQQGCTRKERFVRFRVSCYGLDPMLDNLVNNNFFMPADNTMQAHEPEDMFKNQQVRNVVYDMG